MRDFCRKRLERRAKQNLLLRCSSDIMELEGPGGVSLETAIRDKYCCSQLQAEENPGPGESGKIREFGVLMRPGTYVRWC